MLLNNRQFGLGALPVLGDFETRSISAENPDGSRAGGAKAAPDDPRHPARELGKGWKVRPCITLDAGSLTTLADITGQGLIQHIWITVHPNAYRDCVLRMYWDGETTPSVEVPLGDFFANGHGQRYNVNSLAVAVNPSGGFNSYWPMPFHKSCRITVENQRDEAIDGFFYQITYALGAVAGRPGFVPRPVAHRHDHARVPGARPARRRQGQRPVRRHVHGLGAVLGRLVGRGRDQVLHRRRRRVSHHLRHRHGGLLLRRVGLRRRAVHQPVHRLPVVPARRGEGAQARAVPLAHHGPHPLPHRT